MSVGLDSVLLNVWGGNEEEPDDILISLDIKFLRLSE